MVERRLTTGGAEITRASHGRAAVNSRVVSEPGSLGEYPSYGIRQGADSLGAEAEGMTASDPGELIDNRRDAFPRRDLPG